jgi:hypothetical protein
LGRYQAYLRDSGRWNDAAGIWKLKKDKAVKKETGFSWTHIQNKVHVFREDDVLHPQRDAIYEKAAEMWEEIKKAGFVPDLNAVLHDELKEELLSHHSEKLTIAFGLISTPEKTTLRAGREEPAGVQRLPHCYQVHLQGRGQGDHSARCDEVSSF